MARDRPTSSHEADTDSPASRSSSQTRQVFANLEAVLTAAGCTFADVIKVNVYLTDLADFTTVNGIYAETFTAPYPARTTVAVAGLPLGAAVEIELIARSR